MKFHYLTIFPEMITSYTGESILKRAEEKKLVSFDVSNIRDFSTDRHNKVDDKPYGGGPGMVMSAEPILRAFSKLKFKTASVKTSAGQRKVVAPKIKVIQLSPSGKMFTNTVATKFAKQYTDIVFICGRYEGVDDRVRKILKADEYSIGEYVLTGGELPALIMTDAVARQIPGVLGSVDSLEEARIASPRVYTRPDTLIWPQSKKEKGKKYKVPEVLLNGDHKKIEEWRKNQQK
ncbi:MAG: tRNA (guanosine(37)-N1)-methyltransferase TrmD [bacterium]